jgi:pimeloyl-ACP methyl ester carboxylesterase
MLLTALLALAPTTVVMVHGAGGGGWEYDLWKPVFERAGYRVVARDLLPASDGLAKTGFEDYVRQVQAWRPVGGNVVLVGASMGGILALRSANLERPSALVLVNSVVPMPVAMGYKNLPKSPPIIRWANGPLKDTEVAMPDSDRKTILWAWKRWRNESGAVMDELRAGIVAERVACPTLVVIGEKDRDIKPEESRKLAAYLKAEVHSYKGLSHVGPLMSTRAREVAQRVVAWLKKRGI